MERMYPPLLFSILWMERKSVPNPSPPPPTAFFHLTDEKKECPHRTCQLGICFGWVPGSSAFKYLNSATELPSDLVAQLVRAWQAICQVWVPPSVTFSTLQMERVCRMRFPSIAHPTERTLKCLFSKKKFIIERHYIAWAPCRGWGYCFCFRHVCGERYSKYTEGDHVAGIGMRPRTNLCILEENVLCIRTGSKSSNPTLYMEITWYNN